MMIKESLQSFFRGARLTFSDKSSLAVFAGMYALLLATLYGFIAIKEATIWQVLLTLLFIGLAPIIFFLMQAAIIDHARAGRIDWARVLRISTKLAVVTIPVILVGVGLMWLLNRWQRHFPVPPYNPPVEVVSPGVRRSIATPPLHWATVLFATARVFIFGVVLPVALIQLWVNAAGRELKTFFRGGARAITAFGQSLGRAFAADGIIVYALGLLIFGLAPYLLLFARIPLPGAWSEIVTFTARVILAAVFIFLGWVITLSAFAAGGGPETMVPQPIADPPNMIPTTAVSPNDEVHADVRRATSVVS